jgi:hypothetical protein
MPAPRNEQPLIVGLGMLLFLLSCAYVPWEHRYYESVFVHKMDTEPYLEYHLGVPSETRYGWVFWRPVAPKSMFADLVNPSMEVRLSTEINIQFLLAEWLGICLFTGGLMLLLKHRKDS